MEMTTDRTDTFKNVTAMQERAIRDLYTKLHLMFNAEAENHDRLLLTIRRMQRYIANLRHIDALRQCTELLLCRFLTPQLVSKSTS